MLIKEGMELVKDECVFSKECYESVKPTTKGVLRTIKGPVAEWGNLNRNNRRYTERLWDKVLESDYVKEQKEFKSLFGEANHPADRFEVDFSRVSHNITELYKVPEKNQVNATIDILDTPLGNILNVLYEYGSVIGYSSRAGGVLHQRKTHIDVDEDSYHFITFDAVPFPSVISARPLNEGADSTTTEKVSLSEEAHEKILKIINESGKKDKEILKDFIYSLQDYDLDKEISVLEGITTDKDNQDGTTLKETTLLLLKDSYRQINQIKNEKSLAERQVLEANSHIEDYKAKLEASIKKIENLTESSKASESVVEEVETLKGTIKDLTDKNNELLDTIKEYEKSISDMEDKVLEMGILQKDLKGFQLKTETQQREILTLNEKLQASLNEGQGLKAEVGKIEENVKQYSDYNSIINELGTTVKELVALQENYTLKTEALTKSKADLQRTEAQLTKVREGVDRVILENDELQNTLKVSESNYHRSQEQITRLNEQMGTLSQKLLDYERDIQVRETALNESKEDLLKSVCGSYGINPSKILEGLKEDFSSSDIHILCESVLSENRGIELIGIEEDVVITPKQQEIEDRKLRLSEAFTSSRRGIKVK